LLPGPPISRDPDVIISVDSLNGHTIRVFDYTTFHPRRLNKLSCHRSFPSSTYWILLRLVILLRASISKAVLPSSWDVIIFKDAIVPLIILSRTAAVGL
jgi:hypothetical protein